MSYGRVVNEVRNRFNLLRRIISINIRRCLARVQPELVVMLRYVGS